ncbi:MAG: hypothetical protein NTX96_01480, partial [Candidatus Zambryskibacteria bacterium]|nr:hypothetical protein [Candidatus Zambryskibacteria bacterium]
MSSDLFFENKKYISVKKAHLLTGYSKDHISKLCRLDIVASKKIGQIWYVGEESILKHKGSSVSNNFLKIEDRYISVKEASLLTGYAKDYISKLCRQQLVVSKMIGRAWFVDEESILKYKNAPTNFNFSQNLNGRKKEEKVLVEKSIVAKSPKVKHSKPSAFKYFHINLPRVITPVLVVLLVLTTFFLKNISPVETTYQALNEIVDYYSTKLGQQYNNLGNVIIRETSTLLNNPALYLVQNLKSLSEKEVNLVKTINTKSVELTLNTPRRIFSFISDSLNGITDARNLTANVITSLNPFDQAGVLVYQKINNLIDNLLYQPTSRLFTTSEIVTPTVVKPKVVVPEVPKVIVQKEITPPAQ